MLRQQPGNSRGNLGLPGVETPEAAGNFLSPITAVVVTIMMVSIVLVITGLGLITIGVVPGMEELGRIGIYLLLSILYITFWLGVAMLGSIVFRSVATSALAVLALWLFFSFFVSLGAGVVAGTAAADTSDPATLLHRLKLEHALSLLSPMELYTRGTMAIIDPMRRTTQAFIQMGRMEQLSLARFSGPLALGQSVLVVAPYMITLIAMTLICFGVSYTVFMRQEIRSL
jgi:ABC-2 type transport system permease protein